MLISRFRRRDGGLPGVLQAGLRAGPRRPGPRAAFRSAHRRAHAAPIDTGSARGDLVAHLAAHLEFARRYFAVELAGILLAGTPLAAQRTHPELPEGFRRGVLGPRAGDIATTSPRRAGASPWSTALAGLHRLSRAPTAGSVARSEPDRR